MVSEAECRESLSEPEGQEVVTALRANTHTGRPLGSDSLVGKLEQALGRRLRLLPPRPTTQKGKKRA